MTLILIFKCTHHKVNSLLLAVSNEKGDTTSTNPKNFSKFKSTNFKYYSDNSCLITRTFVTEDNRMPPIKRAQCPTKNEFPFLYILERKKN